MHVNLMGPTAVQKSFDETKSQELTNKTISLNDPESIINNRHSFYHRYCTIFAKHKLQQNDFFGATHDQHMVVITGKDSVKSEVEKEIEILRKQLLSSLERRESVQYVLIPFGESMMFLRNPAPTIDLSDWTSVKSKNIIHSKWHRDIVHFYLPSFLKSLGATYSEEEINQNVIVDELEEEIIKSISVTITWDRSCHKVYPIPGMKIAPRENAATEDYALYKRGLCCDFTLTSNEGISIPVHSLVLYKHGGAFLQKQLESHMRETADRKISFSDCNEKQLNLFLDYIYLGHSKIEERFFGGEKLDLYSLLSLAHRYQIEPLVNCCTNLISLDATSLDAELINYLAKLYENKHLHNLAHHLKAPTNITLLKV